MSGGRLIASGPVAELIARAGAHSLEEAYLGFVR
jgi:hypothetical protein